MSADPETLLALPDTALVPVGWVRELIEGLDSGGREHEALGLTVQQVADETGRAVSTVRTWCADGRLPGAKRLRGREWRVPRSALRALLHDDDPPARNGGAQRLDVPRGGLSAWRNTR